MNSGWGRIRRVGLSEQEEETSWEQRRDPPQYLLYLSKEEFGIAGRGGTTDTKGGVM